MMTVTTAARQLMLDVLDPISQQINDDAHREGIALANDPVEANARTAAYVEASRSIATEYRTQLLEIYSRAQSDAESYQLPVIDGLVMVNMMQFARPSFVQGGAVVDGWSFGGTIVTISTTVGWDLIDAQTGQKVDGDIYDLDISSVGDAYLYKDGTGGSVEFDLAGLTDKMWDRVGYTIAENFYTHERPVCEEPRQSRAARR